ncbi:MAG: hypothetical protein HS111_31400 [Kofleriaceae bacterium]|nr:hypothetical protein [Kofleriaceae bacterium]
MGRAVGLAVVTLVVACGAPRCPPTAATRAKPRPWEKPRSSSSRRTPPSSTSSSTTPASSAPAGSPSTSPAPARSRSTSTSPRRAGGGGTSDEGEGLDLDVGAELLDGASWNVLARSNLETDDAHDLKKTLKAADLPEGRYYIHLYLPGPPRRRRRRGQGRLRPRRPALEVRLPQPGRLRRRPARHPAPRRRARGPQAGPPHRPPATDRAPAAHAADAAADRWRRRGHGRDQQRRTGRRRRTIVTISAGTADGLENGLSGSIRGVRNSSFRLSGCTAATCRAKVKAPIDDVRGAAGITITLK